jgi:hypothetical protein
MANVKKFDRVSESRPRQAVFAESFRTHPRRLVIMTEGDSWFSYPINRNIVDYLEMMNDFTILRLEHSGDEARQILKKGGEQMKRMRDYLRRYPFELLMFSGGGNDIVDENLATLLVDKKPGTRWLDCIDPQKLTARLDEIEAGYRGLLDMRDAVRPRCQVVAHCYDYVVPMNRPAKSAFGLATAGPWIYPRLVEKGIDPKTDGIFIVRHLIDEFYARLAAIAAAPGSKFHVVDTRRTLIPADPIQWADEMHPSGVGAELLARQWRLVLAQLFPGKGF